MRYLSTPEFNKKLGALSSLELIQVGNVVDYLQNNDKELIYRNAFSLGGDIYFVGSRGAGVYFTISSDGSGDYLLLLDFTVDSQTPTQKEFFAVKDPRKNTSLNPIHNHNINPIYNHNINPIYNHTINPVYNHSINPVYNHTINPIYNHTINPVYNHSINPVYNHTINPVYNHSINPVYNRGFGGPFIYSKDLQQGGYLVQANDQVSLLFDMSAEFSGIGVRHPSGLVILFDIENKNVGCLVPANNDVFLRFDAGTTWTGMVV